MRSYRRTSRNTSVPGLSVDPGGGADWSLCVLHLTKAAQAEAADAFCDTDVLNTQNYTQHILSLLHKGHLRAGFRGGLSLQEECETTTVKLT